MDSHSDPAGISAEFGFAEAPSGDEDEGCMNEDPVLRPPSVDKIEIFSVKNPPKKSKAPRKSRLVSGTSRNSVSSSREAAVLDVDVPDVDMSSSRRAAAPALPALPPAASLAPRSVLNDDCVVDCDEEYTVHERALNEFTRLHPMLSLEATSQRTLQVVANLIKDVSIPTREVPVVSKTHDDLFLSPPDDRIGERFCCCGDKCIARWLAIWRFGDNTTKAFVCKEFLLPDAFAEFKRSGALPEKSGKCLLCARYYTTYIYRLCRLDPQFKPSSVINLQSFGNVIGEANTSDMISHCSSSGTTDGYHPSAMLFVDEQWASSASARSDLGTLLWRPVVRFNASHYEYVLDEETGIPCIIQRSVVTNGDESDRDFGVPASSRA